MQRPIYHVIVGNIGMVCTTRDRDEADVLFDLYKERSRDQLGRCADEPVHMTRDGEVVREHQPPRREVRPED